MRIQKVHDERGRRGETFRQKPKRGCLQNLSAVTLEKRRPGRNIINYEDVMICWTESLAPYSLLQTSLRSDILLLKTATRRGYTTQYYDEGIHIHRVMERYVWLENRSEGFDLKVMRTTYGTLAHLMMLFLIRNPIQVLGGSEGPDDDKWWKHCYPAFPPYLDLLPRLRRRFIKKGNQINSCLDETLFFQICPGCHSMPPFPSCPHVLQMNH